MEPVGLANTRMSTAYAQKSSRITDLSPLSDLKVLFGNVEVSWSDDRGEPAVSCKWTG